MTSFTAKKCVALKMVYDKKKIQIFGMKMPFISSSEALPRMKYAFFASLDEISGILIPKIRYLLCIAYVVVLLGFILTSCIQLWNLNQLMILVCYIFVIRSEWFMKFFHI